MQTSARKELATHPASSPLALVRPWEEQGAPGGDGGQSPSGGGCTAWSQADRVTGLLHEVWATGSSQNNFLSFDEITSRAHIDNKVDVII